jgi:CRISPR/Cas system-associated exonuclease Cas4 (RecB family)
MEKLEKLHISATNLAAFTIAKFCPKCAWYLMKMGNEVPFRKSFPGLMGDLDRLEKDVVSTVIAETGESPEWLEPFADAGPPLDIWQVAYYHTETSIEFVGRPDAVLPLNDDSYGVIDYKTAKFRGKDDAYWPSYPTQVNAYAFLLERQEEDYSVSRGAIVYFEVQSDLHGDSLLKIVTPSGIRPEFRVKVVDVEINPEEIIPPLLERARKLFDREAPPKGRSGCEDCELLASLMELHKTAEVADKLAHTWKDQERVLLRKVLDYQLARRAARTGAQDPRQAPDDGHNGRPEGIDPEGMVAAWDWTDK